MAGCVSNVLNEFNHVQQMCCVRYTYGPAAQRFSLYYVIEKIQLVTRHHQDVG
jgi:hypothetical protein